MGGTKWCPGFNHQPPMPKPGAVSGPEADPKGAEGGPRAGGVVRAARNPGGNRPASRPVFTREPGAMSWEV